MPLIYPEPEAVRTSFVFYLY